MSKVQVQEIAPKYLNQVAVSFYDDSDPIKQKHVGTIRFKKVLDTNEYTVIDTEQIIEVADKFGEDELWVVIQAEKALNGFIKIMPQIGEEVYVEYDNEGDIDKVTGEVTDIFNVVSSKDNMIAMTYLQIVSEDGKTELYNYAQIKKIRRQEPIKDINGRKIYRGDFVRAHPLANGAERFGTIERINNEGSIVVRVLYPTCFADNKIIVRKNQIEVLSSKN